MGTLTICLALIAMTQMSQSMPQAQTQEFTLETLKATMCTKSYANKQPCLGYLERLRGEKFYKKDGTMVPAEMVLREKRVIAFYFSAHWCPHCIQFTPKLIQFYNMIYYRDAASINHLVNQYLEIVFISQDRDVDEMKAYFGVMGDWLSVPFGSQLGVDLKKMFDIKGIPSLVIFRTDGTLIEKNGTPFMMAEGPAEARLWLQAEKKRSEIERPHKSYKENLLKICPV